MAHACSPPQNLTLSFAIGEHGTHVGPGGVVLGQAKQLQGPPTVAHACEPPQNFPPASTLSFSEVIAILASDWSF